ncbi:VanZ family protein [Algoriphagus halophilus]|uniref:Glycopeptide antibiotics resistance protein n=1 Tax=Algoriphagus halophilus TaxID=226505 RepID=A0A1N6D6R6_9BACT|nr:VanZ family protein [Algoriphagus halophilus]SIN66407.1 Glycopeptide antibiotics resistance protein [Algoriphagus halophilus]
MNSHSIPNDPKIRKANQWTKALLAIYLLVLVWIILLKLGVQFSYMEKRSVNLIPFITLYLSKMEVLLNVVIFIPLGTYTATLMKSWSFSKQLFSFFLLSLLFESLQIILKIGTFDVTDLITNTMGGWIGYLLYQIFHQVLKDTVKTQQIVNRIASIGTFLMITLLILLKLNMLPIRYQ